MRAIQAMSYGGPEVLQLVELPVPSPLEGEVLVRVRSAGTNPVDWKARQGLISGWFDDGPYVWGWDISGVVEAVGSGVEEYAVGDEVYGMPRFPALARAYAEYVTVPADQLAPKPDGLDHVHAAAIPLAGLTALQVIDVAGVDSEKRVLVNAAAGGVGHLAVQLAKAKGAFVIGTARGVNHEFLRSCGADELVDYSLTDIAGAIQDVDIVIDGVGDASLVRTIKPGGIIVPLPGGVSEELASTAAAADVQAMGHMVHPDGAGLRRLNQLIDEGQLRVEVSETVPLEEVGKAHQLLSTGHVRGKIVLTL